MVDHDPSSASRTKALLALAPTDGLVVEVVSDAASALEALLANRHDVCLMDCGRGDAPSLDLLDRARAGGTEVPIVMVARSHDRSVDLAAMEHGAADFLEKDALDPRTLERSIRYAITHHRQEAELAARNERLEQLDAEKNALLGMAAHDLRSPLGVVYGYASLLAEDPDAYSPEETHEMMQIIARSSAFMRGLIDDLLDLTSIEAGTLRLRLVPTDPVELARKNVALNQMLGASKHIEIHLEAEPGLPLVEVDDARFDQVLGNLLSNAVKYSPAGTRVLVRVRASGGFVCFEVVDEGRGIAPEFLDTIFTPFAKEGATGTAGEKSTGLGLAIVKRIVAAHGGRIGVKSALGGGSTFSVWLPVQHAREAPR